MNDKMHHVYSFNSFCVCGGGWGGGGGESISRLHAAN